MRWALAFAVLAFAAAAAAQPNGVLLVAKPGLPDPNFAETVVLVTRTGGDNTVGVILNRPTSLRLVQLAPRLPGAETFTEPLHSGGPVMPQVVVALFSSEGAPAGPAFRALPGVWLSMHPQNLETILARPAARMRLFAGFSGWAPQQLEREVGAGTWYVVRATDEIVFRKDTSGMWEELVEKARGARAAIY